MSPTSKEPLRFVLDALDRPEVLKLVDTHLRLMTSQSPICSMHSPSVSALRADNVQLWSAWLLDPGTGKDSHLVGCAALKRLSDSHGELKTCHVYASFRCRGFATSLVQHVEDQALKLGLRRVSLETGSASEFGAARQLYTKCGYVQCPPFADYVLDPLSVFMTRRLP